MTDGENFDRLSQGLQRNKRFGCLKLQCNSFEAAANLLLCIKSAMWPETFSKQKFRQTDFLSCEIDLIEIGNMQHKLSQIV